MNRFRRLLSLLAMLLGLLGVTACAAATWVVWSTGTRLKHANEIVFAGIDKSVAAVRDRVQGAQRRVQASKITTENIKQSVQNWTRAEASERLASRLDIEGKAEQLALGLWQADLWLETSETSMQGVQRALEIASSLGAPVDVALVDRLLERLAAVRRQLTQSTETVEAIRESMAQLAEGEAQDERMTQVAQWVLRIIATLGEIDSRLGESANRLTDVQSQGQHLKSKSHFYIATAEICGILLIAWMAVGQIMLCRHSWNDLCRDQSQRMSNGPSIAAGASGHG